MLCGMIVTMSLLIAGLSAYKDVEDGSVLRRRWFHDPECGRVAQSANAAVRGWLAAAEGGIGTAGGTGFASVGSSKFRGAGSGWFRRAPRTSAEFARRSAVGLGLHSTRGTPPRRTSIVVTRARAALSKALDARVGSASGKRTRRAPRPAGGLVYRGEPRRDGRDWWL